MEEIPPGRDWPDVVDNFVTAEPRSYVLDVIAQLDRLLAMGQTESQLDRIIIDLGSDYLPPGERVKEWLIAVGERLARRLATRAGQVYRSTGVPAR